jgi:flagella basal body P-ring formation protein FlgA
MMRAMMMATILCTVAGNAGATGIEGAVQAAAERVMPEGLAIVGVTVSKTLPWPKGAVASLEWHTAPKAGRMSVMLAVYHHEKIIGNGWAQLEIAPLRDVVVAKRDLRAGDLVMLGDVAREKRPTKDRGAWEVDPDVLAGAVTMRDIRVGEILTKTTVAGPPPIARGSGVDVVAKRGSVTVSTRGTLERAARPGESTAARTASGLLVRGRLVDARTLLVDGTDR